MNPETGHFLTLTRGINGEALKDHINEYKTNIHINEVVHLGNTAIHHVCYTGFLCGLNLIIDNFKDCNVNIKNNFGNTPLHITCEQGYVSSTKQLLKNKAIVNVENNNGITPLHNAILSGNTYLIEIILDYGGNLKDKANDGRNCFSFATKETKIWLDNWISNIEKKRMGINQNNTHPSFKI